MLSESSSHQVSYTTDSEVGSHSYAGKSVPPSYLEALSKFIDAPVQGSRFLDIGAGTGDVGAFAQSLGYMVVQSDRNPAGLPRDNNPISQSVVAEAEHLPFLDGLFACVHAKDVLVHIAHRMDFFSQVHRVLHARGVCIISSAESYLKGNGYYPVRKSDLKQSLSQCGFFIEHTVSYRPKRREWSQDWYGWRNVLVPRFIVVARSRD